MKPQLFRFSADVDDLVNDDDLTRDFASKIIECWIKKL